MLIQACEVIVDLEKVVDSTRHGTVGKHGEGVALAGRLALGNQEGVDELWGIRDQRLAVPEEHLVDGKDGVLAHIGVAMLETGAGSGHKRLEQFGLLDLLKEAEGGSTDVLVGMLEVVSDGVAEHRVHVSQVVHLLSDVMKKRTVFDGPHQDHLLLELAVVVELRADLPVEVEELLDCFGLGRQDILNDGHQQLCGCFTPWSALPCCTRESTGRIPG